MRIPYLHSRLIAIFVPLAVVVAGTVRFHGPDMTAMMLNGLQISAIVMLAMALCVINPLVGLLYAMANISAYTPVFNLDSYKTVYHSMFYGMNVYLYAYLVCFFYGKKPIVHGIRALCLINLALMAFQFFGVDPIFMHNPGESFTEGFNGGRNINATFLLFCIPAFMYHRWWYTIPLIVAGIVTCFTSGPIVWLAAASVYFSWRFKIIDHLPVSLSTRQVKMLTYGAVSLFIVSVMAFFYYVDTPGFERLEYWRNAIKLLELNPFNGYGIGQFASISAANDITGTKGAIVIPYLYNSYLQVVFEMGSKVIIPLVLYIAYLLWNLGKISVQSAFAVVLVLLSGMSHYVFQEAPTAYMAIVILAMSQAETKLWKVNYA